MEKYFYFAFIRVFRLFLFSNGKKAANKFFVVSSGVYELLVDGGSRVYASLSLTKSCVVSELHGS